MQDVRTILLSKMKPGDAKSYSRLFQHNYVGEENEKIYVNNFVTIGNYDAAMVFKTTDYSKVLTGEGTSDQNDLLYCFSDEKRILSELYTSNNKTTSDSEVNKKRVLYHPIHIIRHGKIEDSETFWDMKKPCFAVTFIYGTVRDSNGDDENDRESYYISHLEEAVKNAMVSSAKLSEENFLMYRSVNLSELVLVCKDDSLKNILEAIATVSYEHPTLQTHTISGFRYDNAHNRISDEGITDEEIPMVKVTGAIRSHTDASVLMNNSMYGRPINNKYIAFGNNDFNLIYAGIETRKIIDVLNSWIEKSEDIDRAFSSLKTRVHIVHDESKSRNGCYNVNEKLLALTGEVQSSVVKCRKLDIQHTEWAYPFVETLNMLADMYHNPALSRIRYFTSDTLLVLNETLNTLLKEPDIAKECIRRNEEILNKFASGFNTVIERLMRVDGYLSQDPGYSSLIYNMIPAGILEYYCSYIYSATEIVNSFTDDTNAKYVYSTLPIPALVPSISFQDILQSDDEPGKLSQVNILNIPYEQIYHSENLLFSVTHEIMHFCGEDIRCRNDRYECFIDFMSAYLINEFKLQSVRDKAYDILIKYFNEHIKAERAYFGTLVPEVAKTVQNVYSDIDLKNRLQKLIFEQENSKKSGRFEVIATINSVSTQMGLLSMVGEIKSLFKECYADLMTVKFLDICGKEYCRITENIETDCVEHDAIETKAVDCVLNLRKALVIHASKLPKHDISNPTVKKLLEIISEVESGIIDERKFREVTTDTLGAKSKFEDGYFDIHCIMALLKYLKTCSNKFDELIIVKRELVKTMRAAYKTGISAKELFNNDFCTLIYEVRDKLDKRIQNFTPRDDVVTNMHS